VPEPSTAAEIDRGSRPPRRDAPHPAAYFSMEVGLSDELPTFSGGLGVLAGDYLRSAADLRLPIVAVTLLYRHGYFRQQLDGSGQQIEHPIEWSPARLLERLEATTSVLVGGREVVVGAWRLVLRGVSGGEVPVYFLDTDRAENPPEDRAITDVLYGGDNEHRLRQEVVLGLGGVGMLRRLGHLDVDTFHMNEGHAALLTLALLDQQVGSADRALEPGDVDAVRERCVFTTHTPVPAGHDRFDAALAKSVLGDRRVAQLEQLGLFGQGELNMSELGIRCSRYVNAVSRRHRAVSERMFPAARVESITNGVHVATWAVPTTVDLFDTHLPGWRADSALLRYASVIPLTEIGGAHASAKRRLLDEVARRTGRVLDPSALTIGLARRAARYKQIDLLFSDLGRLRDIAERTGPLQVVCSGKAHPLDEQGKALLRKVVAAAQELGDAVPVVVLENYNLGLATLLCAGTDVWLNTPAPPNEASGTSGMKAALNGVPSLSVPDGWWIEGCVEGVTGWAIGEDPGADGADGAEGPGRHDGHDHDVHVEAGKIAASLYDKLEHVVAPLFHKDEAGYRSVMRNAIALNGSFFSTDRMVREYALNAYRWPPAATC